MDKMKKIVTIVVLCMATCTLWAQNEVNLVVSGEGKNKEEATFKALRSAIEQAYGTFVSANTTVLNDKLVADEIVSLSSGNIKKYEYVSENKMPDGNTFVTLSATVSIDKLVSFAESKGMEAELKGGLFAMNIKKMEFDKQAEEKAVENLCKQLETMLPTLFDYEIKVEEPKTYSDTQYYVSYYIAAKPNNNMVSMIDIMYHTLTSISLSNSERNEYLKVNKNTYQLGAANDFFNNTFLLSLEGIETWRIYTSGRIVTKKWFGSNDIEDINLLKKYCNYWHIPIKEEKVADHGTRFTIESQYKEVPLYFRSIKSVNLIEELQQKGIREMFKNIYVEDNLRKLKTPSFKNPCYPRNDGKNANLEFSCYGKDWCTSWPSSPYYYSDGYGTQNRYLSQDKNDNLVKYAIISGRIIYTLDEISKITSISVRKAEDVLKEYKRDETTGIYYKFYDEIHKEAAKPKTGDLVGIRFMLRAAGSTLIPITYNEIEMDSVDYNDLYAAIRMMHIGDSATFIFNGQEFYDLMMDEEYEFGEEPLFLDIKLYGRLPKEEFEKLKLQRKETEDSTNE